MLYTHEPNDERVKYYVDGYIKVVNGLVFVRDGKTYVYDFYHDEDYLIKPNNEVTEGEALKEFINKYGDSEGFYTYNY